MTWVIKNHVNLLKKGYSKSRGPKFGPLFLLIWNWNKFSKAEQLLINLGVRNSDPCFKWMNTQVKGYLWTFIFS